MNGRQAFCFLIPPLALVNSGWFIALVKLDDLLVRVNAGERWFVYNTFQTGTALGKHNVEFLHAGYLLNPVEVLSLISVVPCIASFVRCLI